MQEEKNGLVENTIFLGIGTICAKCLSFFLVPLFSRWLSTGEYGDFDLYVSYVTILIPLMTLATTEALFRFLVDEAIFEKKKQIITSTSIFSCVLSAVVAVVVFIVIHFINPQLAGPFVVYLIADTLFNFSQYFVRGLQKLRIYAWVGAFNVVFQFIFVFIFVRRMSMGTSGMLYGYAIGFFLCSIIILIISKFLSYIELKSFNFELIKTEILYSLPMIPNAISWWIINVSDRTIINVFLGSSFNGLYAVANRVPSLCTTLFNVFHLSWQQDISLKINDSNRNQYINRIFNKTIQTMVSICLPVISVNYFLFRYLFDISYFDGTYQVPILMASVIVNVMAQFMGGIFIALKEPRWNGGTTAISAAINLGANFALIQFIGLYAASVSTLVAFIALFIIRFFVLKRQHEICVKMDIKTIACLGCYVAFIVIDLMHIAILSAVLLAVGIALFIIINRGLIKSILKRFLPQKG